MSRFRVIFEAPDQLLADFYTDLNIARLAKRGVKIIEVSKIG